MNCKPGDLAVIVRTPKEGHYDMCLGRVVTVTSLRTDLSYVAWHFKWNGATTMGGRRGHRCVSIPDFALRPIRDPGEDARDETLEWLPTPSRSLPSPTKEPA